LQVAALSKTYSAGDCSYMALDGIDVAIDKGEFFVCWDHLVAASRRFSIFLPDSSRPRAAR